MITMKKTTQPSARGRPRTFDRDAMLAKALELFWEHGYEGVSIARLVEAMGIAPPSLYSAFGSKEALYREALELYLSGPGSFIARALAEETTAKAVVRRILREAAQLFTAKSHPRGCFVASGELDCAPENQELAHCVAALRTASLEALTQRLIRARKEGELPAGADVKSIARFYGAIIQGMSVQARDGATAAELTNIAEIALRAWPVT